MSHRDSYGPVESNRLDRAMQQRLAKLKTLPVDVSGLERRLTAEMGETSPASNNRYSAVVDRLPRWWRWSGVAAAILITLSLIVALPLTMDTPAVAHPPHMAKIHHAMVSGEMPVAATDMAALRRLLTMPWDGRQTLEALPDDLVATCCLVNVGTEPMLGAVIDHAENRLSVVIAQAQGVRFASGEAVVQGDRRYTVHQIQSTNMAMIQVDDRFVCLMGEVPPGMLIEVMEQALAPVEAVDAEMVIPGIDRSRH